MGSGRTSPSQRRGRQPAWLPSGALVVLLSSLAFADAPRAVIALGGERLGVGDVEARLAAMPRFQLRTFGTKESEIRHAFVERVLIPELRMFAEAARLRLPEQPRLRPKVDEALRRALEDELRREALQAAPITRAEVAAYYAEHEHEFVRPERLRLWRILVADEARANALLERLGRQPSLALFTELTRDASLDKTTYLKKGDLGFVHADGATDVDSRKVAPELFAAATRAKDGELVPKPVKEGEHYAVVWRRGRLKAEKRSLDEVYAAIERILEEDRTAAAIDALLVRLRREHVSALDAAPLGTLSVDAFGSLDTRRRPSIPRRRTSGERPAAPPNASAGDPPR